MHRVQPRTCTCGFFFPAGRSEKRAMRTSLGARSALQTGQVRRRVEGGRHRGQPVISMILPPVGESRSVEWIRSPEESSAPHTGHGHRRPLLAVIPSEPWLSMARSRSGAGVPPREREVRTRIRTITAVTTTRTAPMRKELTDDSPSTPPTGRSAHFSSFVGIIRGMTEHAKKACLAPSSSWRTNL